MESKRSSIYLQHHVDSNAHKSIQVLEFPKLDAKESVMLNNVLLKQNLASLSAKDLHKIKDISRKNIPLLQRAQYWLMFSGGLEVKRNTPNLYKDTCDDLLKDNNSQCKTIKLTSNSHFLTPTGCYSLRKLLYIIYELNPDIVYCPMLEQLGAIMLHFMNEEDVFACLSGILNKNLIDETKSSNIVSDTSMQDLLKSREKKAYVRLESFVTSHAEVAGHKLVIFPCLRKIIFDRLSFAHLVRIVDCFLIEGPKIFYRVGLHLLNLFYIHSLTFKHLLCSSPHDLVATIGQHMQSLQVTPDVFIKNIFKISLASKQLAKLKQTNMTMCHSHELDYTEDIFTQQVVAVNLKEVSDIIEPLHWQLVCGWLPLRIQVKKPYLLFTTNIDGYNLKTLYCKCEEAQQCMIIIRTIDGEVLGAYLSTSLMERHSGHQNLSFFGTGETFIFTLSPEPFCYHWNISEELHTKVSRYVFVNTLPLDEEDGPGSKSKRQRGSSFVRNFSHRFSRRFLQSSSHNDLAPGVPENINFGTEKSLNKVGERNVELTNKGKNFKSSFESSSALDTTKNAKIAEYLKNNIEDEEDIPISLKKFEHEPVSTSVTQKKNQTVADEKNVKVPPVTNGNFISYIKDQPDGKNVTPVLKGTFVSYIKDETAPQKENVQNPHKSNGTFVSYIKEQTAVDGDNVQTPPESKDLVTNIKDKTPVHDETSTDQPAHKSLSPNKMEVEGHVRAALFISCDDSRMVIGGGDGEAIAIDGDIHAGRSTWCRTFQNAPLSSHEHGDFVITRLDVFGFH